ncbi:BsuPI-related putative proteinase inhibitor [Halobacillus seohaensis]|uniref:Intracellular proteinase inhibitor BsuPI domain-containing protein n=1 Tax=Halobacillus seohaensis TaxID=447421 RepID=A0ABW2ENV2_9BACI
MTGILAVLLVGCTNSNSEENSDNEKDINKEEETSEGESEAQSENIVSLIEQLSFDAEVSSSEGVINFSFFIENEADNPMILGFNSSQKYEIILESEDGEEVYRYSDDQAFSQQLTTEELQPGDRMEADEVLEQDLPTGEYDATMSFLVTSINDQSLNTIPFEITKSITVGQAEGDDTEASQSGGEIVFRELSISGEEGQYTISGEAKVRAGEFFYRVEDGHNVIIEEESVQVEDPDAEWSSFETQADIVSEDLPHKGALIITMYDTNAEGQEINMNYAQLENFDN